MPEVERADELAKLRKILRANRREGRRLPQHQLHSSGRTSAAVGCALPLGQSSSTTDMPRHDSASPPPQAARPRRRQALGARTTLAQGDWGLCGPDSLPGADSSPSPWSTGWPPMRAADAQRLVSC